MQSAERTRLTDLLQNIAWQGGKTSIQKMGDWMYGKECRKQNAA